MFQVWFDLKFIWSMKILRKVKRNSDLEKKDHI